MKVIEVIYENGVFKPLEKVELPEKSRLKIKIEDVEDSLKEFCGLIESKITKDLKTSMRYEAKTWRKL